MPRRRQKVSAKSGLGDLTGRRCVAYQLTRNKWGEVVKRCYRYSPAGAFPAMALGDIGLGGPVKRRARGSGFHRLRNTEYGLPEEKKYPLDTCGRAANAKGRATQMLNKGYITKAQHSQIIRRAEAARRRMRC